MSGINLSHLLIQGKHFKSLFVCNFATRRNEFGKYNIVMPEIVSEKLHVPRFIPCPPYIRRTTRDDIVPKLPEVKNSEEVEKMRKSCALAREVLDELGRHVKVGVTTDALDKIAHKMCIENNAYPSPLGFNGFPKSVCTSVNNVACHGIPDNRPLKNGDIINIDVSVYLNGYHGDCCGTYTVGDVDEKGLALIEATHICLQRAINACRDGEYFSVIGSVINKTALDLGFNVVPCFAGHGIGPYFHGPPDIIHIENDYPGKMMTGMTFTIEPVLTQGEPEILILEDGWTAVTVDNARAAQFEHTILINGPTAEILTLSKSDAVD
ncbi:UNVERIFIED_CONTAM: hypothetical protein PYX00_009906 [Menopon gallinae]|uniref:Methionine aminopeptidase n=1 Tax=Menopon gallinae TaxID=328185 RepID=A0AAW2HDE1_9NEOP